MARPTSPADPAEARARLEEDAAALADQVAALEAQFDGFVEASELVATDDEHDPEGHTIAFERQQVAALLRDARARLAALDEARRRLEVGSYGWCRRCGDAIGAQRLDALPGAEHCIRCAP